MTCPFDRYIEKVEKTFTVAAKAMVLVVALQGLYYIYQCICHYIFR